MQCKQCNRGTAIKVTAHNQKSNVERRGFLIWVITLPWRIIRWLFRFGVKSERETYHKETFWRCNYCGESFKDDVLPKEENAPASETGEV